MKPKRPGEQVGRSTSGDLASRELSVASYENAFMEGVYDKIAKVYDWTFGPTLHPGRLQAIERMNIQPDERVLEVEGDELCRRIKAQMMRVVPVILYSGLPELELKERARLSNADAYVCKIRGIEGLIARMDELLSDEILF